MNDKPADPLHLSYARAPRRWRARRIGAVSGAGVPVLANIGYWLVQSTPVGQTEAVRVAILIVNLPAVPCLCGFLVDDSAPSDSAFAGAMIWATLFSAAVWGAAGAFVGWLAEGTPWEQERRHPGGVESGKKG
jgi:hypothetical protein